MSMFSPLKSAYSRSRPPASSQQQHPSASAATAAPMDDLEELDRSMSRIEALVRKHDGRARARREREERDRRRKRTSVPPSEAFSGVTNGRRVRRGSSIVKEEGAAKAVAEADSTNDTTTASQHRRSASEGARASVGSIDEDVVSTAADTFGDSTMAAAAASASDGVPDGGEGDVGSDENDGAAERTVRRRRRRPRRRRRHACGATFVDFDDEDEEEVVELLRRVAELVVRGEQRASLIERAGAAAAAAAAEAKKKGQPSPRIPSSSGEVKERVDDDDDDGDSREVENEGDADAEAGAAAVTAVEREREKEAHSALFNRFLERQGLALVVNIVSGKAFSSSPTGSTGTGTRIKKNPKAGATKKIAPPVELSQERGNVSDGAIADEIIGDGGDGNEEDERSREGEGTSDRDRRDGDGAATTVKNPQSGDEPEADADVDEAGHKDNHQGGGNNDGDNEEETEEEERAEEEELCTCVYLPPIGVATQAVQSMSILFQNVCLATSLYLLLSNNLVNDLINLPLELYGEAASLADENAEEGGGNTQSDEESDYSDDESSNGEGEHDDGDHVDGNKQQQQQAEVEFKASGGEDREGGDGDDFNEEQRRRRRRTRLASQPRRRRLPWDSAEMSELATHFVSFLKSLAMRINPETLQFYLKHPARPFSRDNGEAVDAADGGNGKGGDRTAPVAATDEVDILLREVGEVDFPLYERALEFCSVEQDSFVRVTAMNICLNMLRLATVGAAAMGEDSAPEFPPSPSSPSLSGGPGASNSSSLQDLLARADGAAPPPPLPLSSPPSSPSNRSRAKSTESSSAAPPELARKGSAAFRHVLKSPDANLVSVVLPLRDRLAVANHVCRPGRVQRFVGPIFFRLLHLCGTLGELMQELDEVEAAEARQRRRSRTGDRNDDDGNDLEDNEDSTGGLEESLAAQQKLLESVQIAAADMQDELLLLDDVFKLGLTALNEQIIEMMLATFIYPMLLQPLLLCARPSPVGGVSTGLVGLTISNASAASSVASANDAVEEADSSSSSPPSRSETVSMLLSSQPNHPFTIDSVSRSLQESGLLTSDGATAAGGESGGKRAGTTERLPSFGHKTTAASAAATATTSPSPAPAKTALFGLFSVFGTITNRPLLQLLFTAMFHPLAPDGSRGELFVAKPSVLCVGKDGKAQIAIDSSQPFSSLCRAHSSAATCAFGRISPDAVEVIHPRSRAREGGEGSERSDIDVDEDDQCCFVLSPALASVFENDPSVQMKANTYRQIVLTCLAGSGERGQRNDLQHVAVLAFGAALSALKDGGAGDVLFGPASSSAGCQEVVAGERTEEARDGEGKDAPLFVQDHSSDDCLRDVTERHGKLMVNEGVGPSSQAPSRTLDHTLELVAALCVSVMSSTVCINGVWRLDYNFTAAHALLNVVASNRFAKEKAVKLVEHRRRQSASFLIQLPSLVDTAFVEKLAQKDKDDGLPKAIIEDTDEHQLDLILDRIFHDHIDGDESCILNALQRERTGKGEDDNKQYFMIQIAKKCSLVEACDQLYGENAFHSTVLVSDSKNAALSCAAASALAHMRLDALATFLRDGPSVTAGFHSSSEEIRSQVFVSRSYDVLPGGIHGGRYEEEDDEVTVAAISPNMYSFLCTEQEADETSSPQHTYPKPGAVVRLVGRVAFPCVCEVTESSAALFTDGRACVIADGVRWQSLYLVFIGRYMLLAEPVKTGSGGNGRIVTSCHLSCMSVSKDKPQTSSASSTARRLVLRHESPDLNPPGAFVLDGDNSSMMVGCGVLVQSRMDLWFEDSGAVCTAFDTFNAKILKARAKRGKRLREALARVASS